MSKSLGNVISPDFESFPSESVRLYFLSEGPQDYDVKFEE